MDAYLCYLSKEAKVNVNLGRMINRMFGHTTPYGIRTAYKYGPRKAGWGAIFAKDPRIYKGRMPKLVNIAQQTTKQ